MLDKPILYIGGKLWLGIGFFHEREAGGISFESEAQFGFPTNGLGSCCDCVRLDRVWLDMARAVVLDMALGAVVMSIAEDVGCC